MRPCGRGKRQYNGRINDRNETYMQMCGAF